MFSVRKRSVNFAFISVSGVRINLKEYLSTASRQQVRRSAGAARASIPPPALRAPPRCRPALAHSQSHTPMHLYLVSIGHYYTSTCTHVSLSRDNNPFLNIFWRISSLSYLHSKFKIRQLSITLYRHANKSLFVAKSAAFTSDNDYALWQYHNSGRVRWDTPAFIESGEIKRQGNHGAGLAASTLGTYLYLSCRSKPASGALPPALRHGTALMSF